MRWSGIKEIQVHDPIRIWFGDGDIVGVDQVRDVYHGLGRGIDAGGIGRSVLDGRSREDSCGRCQETNRKSHSRTRSSVPCRFRTQYCRTMDISIIKQTEDFLTRIDRLGESDISGLQTVLREHNRLYYAEQSPIISDREYDRLFTALKNLEERYGVFDPTSPTKRIDVLVSSQFQKGFHTSPMISLDNTYDEADLLDFENRIRNILKSDRPLSYDMELKFDGLGLSLTYRDGRLVRALTRGNGIE